jgi:hypothetical protein
MASIRLAGEGDLDVVARLMAGFRDWWQKDAPDDASIARSARRLLADPKTALRMQLRL